MRDRIDRSGMKFLFFPALILFFALNANASPWSSNKSSRTTTNETLSRVPGVNPGDILNKVIVTSCSTTAGAEFRLYDSSGVATSTIALNIQLSTRGAIGYSCQAVYDFDLRLSSSLTYTKTNGGEVVILWLNQVFVTGEN